MPGFTCRKCGAVANHMTTCGICHVPMQPDTDSSPSFVVGASTPAKSGPKTKSQGFKLKAPQPSNSASSPFSLLPSPPQVKQQVVLPVAQQRLRIIHFDVSQGESTLLSYINDTAGTAKHVLVDGGRQGRGVYVRRCLKKLNITQLDYVICTHADNDHYEGLFSVGRSSKIKIGKMLLSNDGLYSEYQKKYSDIQDRCTQLGIKYELAKKGKLIQDGPFTLEIKYVGTPKDKEGNHASIACIVSMNAFRYYTAGDLPSDIEDGLLGKVHMCAFKCGHHGAAGSTSTEFVGDISPTAAFLSAGRHGHGHPHQPVIDNLVGQASVQRFYSTQCIPARTGFGKTDKGLVGAQRKSGVLGHLVLYTDNLLSAVHDNAKVNFHVFIPKQGGAGWRQFNHVCGKTGLPVEDPSPQTPVPMPECLMNNLSKTVQDFPSAWAQLRTSKPPKRPGSPVAYFLEDEDNFTRTNAKSGTVKRKWEESEHIAEDKAMSACFICLEANVVATGKKMKVSSSKSTRTVQCSHGVSFFLCEDCFVEEFGEDKDALSELDDSGLCG